MMVIIVLIALLCLSVATAYWQKTLTDSATKAANAACSFAEALQLASDSRWILTTRPDHTDIAVALGTLSLHHRPTVEGRWALRSALSVCPDQPVRINTGLDRIWYVAVDQSGGKVLVVGEDGPAVFESKTGQRLWQASRETMAMHGAFSEDGRFVAVWNSGGGWFGTDEVLEIWHVGEQDALLRVDKGHSAQFSSDGRTAAYLDEEGVAHVIDTGSQNEIWRSEAGQRYQKLALGESGTLWALARKLELEFYRSRDAKVELVFRKTGVSKSEGGSFAHIAINNSLTRMAAVIVPDGVFTEWNYENGDELRSFSVDYDGDPLREYGQLRDNGVWSEGGLTTGASRYLKFDGDNIAYLESAGGVLNLYHAATVTAAVQRETLVITGDATGHVAIWRVDPDVVETTRSRIVSARLSANGEWFVYRGNETLYARRVAGEPLQSEFEVEPVGSGSAYDQTWVSPAGKYVAAVAKDGRLTVWERDSRVPVLVGEENPMEVAFAQDESTVVVSYLLKESSVHALFSNSSTKTMSFETSGNVLASAVSPDGAITALTTWSPAESTARIFVVETETGRKLVDSVMPASSSPRFGLKHPICFDDSGKQLFVADPLGVQIRAASNGWREAGRIENQDSIECLATGKDGLLIVVTGAFTGKTTSTEARGANIIRVLKVSHESGRITFVETDRIETGERAIVAADIDAEGDFIHVIEYERSVSRGGVKRVPLSTEQLLKQVSTRVHEVPASQEVTLTVFKSMRKLRNWTIIESDKEENVITE